MKALTLEEIKEQAWWELVKRLNEEPFNYNIGDGEISLKGDYYDLQKRIALRNLGIIDPDSIEEYIATDGYFALRKALAMDPKEVVDIVKSSGLRGRGGAGFSTGRKWESAAYHKVDQKYVICNADEGDPGAFMDRSILEGDPHSVLEGMAICGYAIGADKGYIYVRAEYPKAVSALITAIEQAERLGVLGENIFESGFNFSIELRLGAGAFVCGESTALMESIEGKRGMPRNKEFRTTERGLWEKPTVINNVETLANIPPIMNKGAEWFSNIGTPLSTGTKVFALVGKVNNPGLVEVPMGMSIYDIVYKIGGGIPDGRKAKAVQTGGPSGGCIPSKMWDTKVDFESLEEVGSIMGSGGMVVMDDKDCMVDIAKFFLEFSVDESCGKCTPCRIGNKRLLELLDKFTQGEAEFSDINKLKNLSTVICTTSLCGLGQSSPNPVLSTLNYFYDEYKEHAVDKHCRSAVCRQLLRYEVNESCVGCTRCLQHCPVDCITGAIRERHYIDPEKCIRCGECFNNCPVDAISVF